MLKRLVFFLSTGSQLLKEGITKVPHHPPAFSYYVKDLRAQKEENPHHPRILHLCGISQYFQRVFHIFRRMQTSACHASGRSEKKLHGILTEEEAAG